MCLLQTTDLEQAAAQAVDTEEWLAGFKPNQTKKTESASIELQITFCFPTCVVFPFIRYQAIVQQDVYR
jgi:hypothetical protein